MSCVFHIKENIEVHRRPHEDIETRPRPLSMWLRHPSLKHLPLPMSTPYKKITFNLRMNLSWPSHSLPSPPFNRSLVPFSLYPWLKPKAGLYICTKKENNIIFVNEIEIFYICLIGLFLILQYKFDRFVFIYVL